VRRRRRARDARSGPRWRSSRRRRARAASGTSLRSRWTGTRQHRPVPPRPAAAAGRPGLPERRRCAPRPPGAGAWRRHHRLRRPTTSSNRDPGRPPAARPVAAASMRPARPAGPHAPEARPGRPPVRTWPVRQVPRPRWRPRSGAPRPGAAPDRTASTRDRSAPARRGWARRRPRPGTRLTVRRSAAADRGTPESFHSGCLSPCCGDRTANFAAGALGVSRSCGCRRGRGVRWRPRRWCSPLPPRNTSEYPSNAQRTDPQRAE
jgi:hypothetical protein